MLPLNLTPISEIPANAVCFEDCGAAIRRDELARRDADPAQRQPQNSLQIRRQQ